MSIECCSYGKAETPPRIQRSAAVLLIHMSIYGDLEAINKEQRRERRGDQRRKGQERIH
jgi:hypothetical protein